MRQARASHEEIFVSAAAWVRALDTALAGHQARLGVVMVLQLVVDPPEALQGEVVLDEARLGLEPVGAAGGAPPWTICTGKAPQPSG